MAQPQEIELKLEVPPERVDSLARLPLLKGVWPNKSQTLLSVYFDTDKQKLRKNGVSLRVRQIDGHFMQTIKKRGNRSVGLFERNEWECDVRNGQPALDTAHDTALAPVLNKKLRRNLKPVFETRVQRWVYPVRKHDSEIELAVDMGTVEAAGRSSPLCEIELELKRGEPADLFELARALGKTVPVTLASKSKAGHGYDLISKGGHPGPAKAEPVALGPNATWVEAFRIIARACLYQLAVNEAAVSRGNAEGVHQMRIGIRRLRTVISLFKDILEGAQTEAMKLELKWLTGELGPARELDVFIKRVVKRANDDHANGSSLDAVAEDLSARRLEAVGKAEQAVASSRFRRLVLDAATWIAIGDWTQNGDELSRLLRERPVVDAASAELRRRSKKIRKQGKKLAKLDARHRHKLRIKTKKLRYAAEFFSGVFPSKKSARRCGKFISKLKAVQDALGDLNDIRVHQRLAREELKSRTGRRKRDQRRAGKAFAAGRLCGREGARFASTMKHAERAHAILAKAVPFWP
ncbi:MAG TPA: CHAD domain-containing protein [Xanthobacteraceae bacterium]